ncbi:unnamed protein product, partial [Amoebophrya sp. A25]
NPKVGVGVGSQQESTSLPTEEASFLEEPRAASGHDNKHHHDTPVLKDGPEHQGDAAPLVKDPEQVDGVTITGGRGAASEALNNGQEMGPHVNEEDTY